MRPPEKKFSMRINPYSYNHQANADLLLRYLMERVPSRAYCVLGITMTDLYSDPLWNFVFGYATYEKRVGVFSFARYAPSFYNFSSLPNPKLLFIRSCKILAHETGHMFGLAHCTAWHCVMNGKAC
jgi:archaemetzincin